MSGTKRSYGQKSAEPNETYDSSVRDKIARLNSMTNQTNSAGSSYKSKDSGGTPVLDKDFVGTSVQGKDSGGTSKEYDDTYVKLKNAAGILVGRKDSVGTSVQEEKDCVASMQNKDSDVTFMERKNSSAKHSEQGEDSAGSSLQSKNLADTFAKLNISADTSMGCKQSPGISMQEKEPIGTSMHIKDFDTGNTTLQTKDSDVKSVEHNDSAGVSVQFKDSAVTSAGTCANCNKTTCEGGKEPQVKTKPNHRSQRFMSGPPRLQMNAYHVNQELFVVDYINNFQGHPYYSAGMQESDLVEAVNSHGLANGDVPAQVKFNLKQLIIKGWVRYIYGGYRYLGPFWALSSSSTEKEHSKQWERLSNSGAGPASYYNGIINKQQHSMESGAASSAPCTAASTAPCTAASTAPCTAASTSKSCTVEEPHSTTDHA